MQLIRKKFKERNNLKDKIKFCLKAGQVKRDYLFKFEAT